MDGKLNEFLDKVCTEIIDASSHHGIRDELTDHFYCLVDTYEDMGHTEEYAVDRALVDLGSPKTIGKKLNNIHTPSVKWIVAWMVCWLISTTFFAASMFLDPDLSSSILLLSVAIDALILKSYLHFLYRSIVKKENFLFVRMNHGIKNKSGPPSYVEKLTNRVFMVIGLVFALLMIVSSIGAAYELPNANVTEILFSFGYATFIIKAVLQVYCSIKHSIFIIDEDGILVVGMLKVMKWEKIASYSFKKDYNGNFSLNVKPVSSYTLKISCLPIDQEKIEFILNEKNILRR